MWIRPVIRALCFCFVAAGNPESNATLSNASISEVAPQRRQESPKICDADGKGLLFPIFENEHEWPKIARGLCYAFGLIYCFVGVSIIADIFMSSIEAITRRKVQVVDRDGQIQTVSAWNATVANLSLMALGSSAPEIFLSIIDLVRKRMYAGDLGPSTIVGSAAFNLLVIVAVCVVCIPYPESREIEHMEVFFLTVAFSVFAYFWMAFILIVQSPDEVEWWEAVATLLFLPMLIWTSYRVDTMGWPGLSPHRLLFLWPCKRRAEESKDPDNSRTGEEKRACFAASKRSSLAGSAASTLSGLMSMTSSGNSERGDRHLRKNIAQCHMLAMSRAPGNLCRVSTSFLERGDSIRLSNSSNGSTRSRVSKVSLHSPTFHEEGEEKSSSVQFLVDRQGMSDDIEKKVLKLCRKEIGYRLRVHYKIELLSAARVLPMPYRGAYDLQINFISTAPPKVANLVGYGQLDLPASGFERELDIEKPKVPDGACKDFLVTLVSVEVLLPLEDSGLENKDKEDLEKTTPVSQGGIGPVRTTQVEVRPFKDPSYLGFISQSMTVPGRCDNVTLKVIVLRKGGCSGMVSCTYCTKALDAVPNYDYQDTEGHLIFSEGVTEQVIEIAILAKSVHRGAYKFLICLEPLDACRFDPAGDGGADSAILTVQIAAREEECGRYDTVLKKIDKVLNIGMILTANSEWKEQIISTPYCNGSEELQESATIQDWIVHVFTLPWKLLFVLVPPTAYGGGWVCFCVSLLVLAVITAVIADCAEIFGCIVDIGDMMTAITFVALGTSMPDLFASKVAAAEEPTADASIVNVTGSNAVNVFLGLGLPWTCATIWWAFRGDLRSEWELEYPEMAHMHRIGCVFVVPAGNLGFCVLAFSCFAVLALSVLMFRRWKLGCELGGPALPKITTAFSLVSMWIGYIFVASWWYARHDVAQDSEVILVIGVTIVVEIIVASGVVVSASMVDFASYQEERAIFEAGEQCEISEDTETTNARRSTEQAPQSSTAFSSESVSIASISNPLSSEVASISNPLSIESQQCITITEGAVGPTETSHAGDVADETCATLTCQPLGGPELVPKARRQVDL